MENLKFWNSVSTTDKSYTQSSNNGGRRSTSINGQYMIMKATEAFGMCGIGWGYEVIEERLTDGEEVYRNNDGVFEVVGCAVNHTIKLRLWFKKDGETGEVFDFGHTPYKYWSQKNNKWICDNEVSKKSLTDAIKRCLSKLGVCADVFLGEFDNQAYQQEAAQEIIKERELKAIEKEENRQKEEKELFAELLEKVKSTKSQDELNQEWPLISRKMATGLESPLQNQLNYETQQHVNSFGAQK